MTAKRSATRRGRAGAAALDVLAPESQLSTTFVGTREFRFSIEARARHLGVGVGATFGEGFLALAPLAVADPLALLDLLPRGLH